MSAQSKIALTALALVTSMLLSGCHRADQQSSDTSHSTAPAPSIAPSLIAAAIATPDRMPSDHDEDAWRLPESVLTFAGIAPGMHVADYFAASGYYSELLSRSVGPSGSVIVYNNPEYAEFAGDALVKRFDKQRLPNAKVVTLPTKEFKPEANSLDAVLFVMAYHDLYWQPKGSPAQLGNPAEVLPALFAALKPNGVVIVVDHAASAGGDVVKVVDAMHRIDPQVVKSDFAKAGFVFDAESKALEHKDDDRTKPVFDPAVRHKTDQFIYRFRKPAK